MWGERWPEHCGEEHITFCPTTGHPPLQFCFWIKLPLNLHLSLFLNSFYSFQPTLPKLHLLLRGFSVGGHWRISHEQVAEVENIPLFLKQWMRNESVWMQVKTALLQVCVLLFQLVTLLPHPAPSAGWQSHFPWLLSPALTRGYELLLSQLEAGKANENEQERKITN